ncbi:MAG: 2-C-methyl-D-erythritol 4-phosphate cytidylyltransferase [Bacillota bacterium]
MEPSKVAAILPAAGRGERMGLARNKVWLDLCGKPVVAWALRVFEDHPSIDRVVLVLSNEDMVRARDLVSAEGFRKVLLAQGGQLRRESVWNGLMSTESFHSWIVVHDAARPLLDPRLIDSVLNAAREHGAALCAVPVSDTLKRIRHDGMVRATVPRDGVYQAQTPQAFARNILLRAHEEYAGPATDDAALVEGLGVAVAMVPGSQQNFKLTRPDDIRLAEAILRSQGCEWNPMWRVGIGYDIHRLGSPRPLILGGVEIPSMTGPEAHSDGDVLAHAIMDALLGATGEPDIGCLFPSSQEFEGADSMQLLRRVTSRLMEKGWIVVNVDATVILERPRLSPFYGDMRERISDVVEAPVSVKATTNEGIGAIGREEGVAAMVVAMVRKS